MSVVRSVGWSVCRLVGWSVYQNLINGAASYTSLLLKEYLLRNIATHDALLYIVHSEIENVLLSGKRIFEKLPCQVG